VSIARQKAPVAQTLEVGVRHDDFHEPGAEAAALVGFEDENVGEVSIRRSIGDDAGETDLLPSAVHSETQGIANGARDNLARNAFAPIGAREKPVDDIEVDPARISRDQTVTPVALEGSEFSTRGQSLCRHSFTLLKK
jgi:hypothetical protein